MMSLFDLLGDQYDNPDLKFQGSKKMKDAFGHHRVKIYNDMRPLKKIIMNRIKEQDREQDSLYAVCAPEGMGKSTLAIWAYAIYLHLKGLNPDLDFKLENICFGVPELLSKVSKSPGKEFFILDESSDISGSRFMEKKSKDIVEAFVLMRQRANIIFICFPNVLRLNTYFREDRIRGVWFIKKTGECWFYSNSMDFPHLTMILDRWNRDYDVKSVRFFTRYAPEFIMKFPKATGKLWDSYADRKTKNISRVLDDQSAKHGYNVEEVVVDKSQFYTLAEAGRYMGISPEAVGRLVRIGRVKPHFFGAKKYVSKDGCDEYMNTKKGALFSESSFGNDAQHVKGKKFFGSENI